jgi:hypothetical protein
MHTYIVQNGWDLFEIRTVVEGLSDNFPIPDVVHIKGMT